MHISRSLDKSRTISTWDSHSRQQPRQVPRMQYFTPAAPGQGGGGGTSEWWWRGLAACHYTGAWMGTRGCACHWGGGTTQGDRHTRRTYRGDVAQGCQRQPCHVLVLVAEVPAAVGTHHVPMTVSIPGSRPTHAPHHFGRGRRGASVCVRARAEYETALVRNVLLQGVHHQRQQLSPFVQQQHESLWNRHGTTRDEQEER